LLKRLCFVDLKGITMLDKNRSSESSNALSEYHETIEIRKIKEYLCEKHLIYVTEYLRKLLKIEKVNNLDCFQKSLFDCTFTNGNGKRVIIYLRLSVEDLQKTEGNVSKSILNQLLMLLTYCVEQHFELVGIFYEENISGSDEERIEWNKSLLFCELRNTDIYICKTQARFARDVEMIEKYLHKRFIEWNIRFLSVVDHSDTAIRGNKLQRQITAIVDENKLAEQSINTKITLRAKNDAGQWTGSFAPFGYIEDPNDMYHFVIDETAAKVVREIYEMYARGIGYLKICRSLNDRKIPTPSRYKKLQGSHYVCPQAPNGSEYWNTDTVRKILMDETYDGVLIQHRTESISYNMKKRKKIPKHEQSVVACSHDRIIDPNISRIVRKKFRERKDRKQFEEIRCEANHLIGLISSDQFGKNTFHDDIMGSLNLGVGNLTKALLSTDMKDIVEKYNYLREFVLKLGVGVKVQDQVQVLSTSNTRAKPDKNGEIHIFSQKVYCKCCGKVFQKNKFKTSSSKSGLNIYKEYLLCRTSSRSGRCACDNKNAIRYEELERIVLDEMNNMLARYYDKTKLQKSYYEQKRYYDSQKDIVVLKKEKNDMEKQIKINEEKFMMIYDDKVSGILSLDEFAVLKDKYQDVRENCKLRIQEINLEILELEAKEEKYGCEEQVLECYQHITKLDRLLVDTFISKIMIGKVNPETKQRDIRIIWNFGVDLV